MRLQQHALDALLRRDLTSFIIKCFNTVDGSQPYLHNWHIELLADYLTRALRRDIKRLVITLPPRNLKSICASVAFPAFALGHNPTLRIVCASYSGELAGKHARDCRAVIETDWYRRIFRKTRIDRRKASEQEFETTARGYRLATSVGGTLTGRGGNFIIIDDPLKPQEALSSVKREGVKQWFDGTLYTRLDDKTNDVIVVVQQRVHVDDLVAHVIDKEDWVHLNLPAIAEAPERFELSDGRVFSRSPGDLLHPEREPLQVIEQARANLGTFFFSAQYQQAPVPEGGNIVKWAWFRAYETAPVRQAGDLVVQSWDTASKANEINDYSVCTTWLIRKKEFFLLNVLRERLEYPYLKKLVADHAGRHSCRTVLIEDKGSGTQLVQDLRRDGAVRPIPIQPESDKITRMSAQSAMIEAGHVLIPSSASWLSEFQSELLQFPHGRFDDQVDSVSQFLGWIDRRSRNRIVVGKFTW